MNYFDNNVIVNVASIDQHLGATIWKLSRGQFYCFDMTWVMANFLNLKLSCNNHFYSCSPLQYLQAYNVIVVKIFNVETLSFVLCL